MPVEIREISIGAQVVDDADDAPAAAPAFDAAELREQILAECAELIRKALERRDER
jgi:hypothetical protein